MPQDARYSLRQPEVTLETFEGESIVIDFASGCYYSLSVSASEMLTLLASGATPSEVAARLGARHHEPSARLAADLDGLVGRLLAERILVVREGAAPALETPLPPPAAAYQPPCLERFEDMREMLLLDPIHELDQATWGAPPASAAAADPA